MSQTKPTQNPVETIAVNELKQAAELETERRKIISQFITSQLREGIDYGTIKINGRAGKPTLFKPGMEKIFSLFKIVSHLKKDEETLSMISAKDIIAYKCELYRDSKFIGEGRGAAAVSEKGRINDTIKIAEKRARMDACLNLGFSEYFTQDLEDMEKDVNGNVILNNQEKDEVAAPTYERSAFTVQEKQELTAQSGNPYAKLITDKGTVIAFKNTMDHFEAGSSYFVSGIWEERNGSKAFVVTCPASEITPIPSEAKPRQKKELAVA